MGARGEGAVQWHWGLLDGGPLDVSPQAHPPQVSMRVARGSASLFLSPGRGLGHQGV